MDRLPGIGEKAEESQNQQERKGDLGAGSSGLRDKDPGHPILEMDMLKDRTTHTQGLGKMTPSQPEAV